MKGLLRWLLLSAGVAQKMVLPRLLLAGRAQDAIRRVWTWIYELHRELERSGFTQAVLPKKSEFESGFVKLLLP